MQDVNEKSGTAFAKTRKTAGALTAEKAVNHTPGPYRAVDSDTTTRIFAGSNLIAETHSYSSAQRIAEGAPDRQTRRANAAFIVTAANSHSALVGALRSAAEFISVEYADAKSEALDGHPIAREARPVWETICAALALA